MQLFDQLGDGLIVLFNGLWAVLGALASPTTLLLAALAGSLAVMCRFELHELDLQARKPSVPRH
jgi:hypothetical protein